MDPKTMQKVAEFFFEGIKLAMEIKKHVRKETLSYPTLIGIIQDNLPPCGCVYCALTRRKTSGGNDFTGLYLDGEKKAILDIKKHASGFIVSAKNIDSEIDEMFQGKDMVLFS